MKKYLVKDTDEGFEVNELDEETTETVETKEIKDENALTDEEIAALKGLAAISADLIKLINEKKESVGDEDEDKDKERLSDDDDDEDDEETLCDDDDDDDDEVVDTDMMKSHDSKRSVGAIARKSKNHDSIDEANDIESAWMKRYGG